MGVKPASGDAVVQSFARGRTERPVDTQWHAIDLDVGAFWLAHSIAPAFGGAALWLTRRGTS